jgi:hypothetical protein
MRHGRVFRRHYLAGISNRSFKSAFGRKGADESSIEGFPQAMESTNVDCSGRLRDILKLESAKQLATGSGSYVRLFDVHLFRCVVRCDISHRTLKLSARHIYQRNGTVAGGSPLWRAPLSF